jgi:hypothetical protein
MLYRFCSRCFTHYSCRFPSLADTAIYAVCNALLYRDLQRQDASLHFAHLESVLLMVEGVSRMGARKAALGLPWQPTYFTDFVESAGV